MKTAPLKSFSTYWCYTNKIIIIIIIKTRRVGFLNLVILTVFNNDILGSR